LQLAARFEGRTPGSPGLDSLESAGGGGCIFEAHVVGEDDRPRKSVRKNGLFAVYLLIVLFREQYETIMMSDVLTAGEKLEKEAKSTEIVETENHAWWKS
jgi:hypothetical protein